MVEVIYILSILFNIALPYLIKPVGESMLFLCFFLLLNELNYVHAMQQLTLGHRVHKIFFEKKFFFCFFY